MVAQATDSVPAATSGIVEAIDTFGPHLSGYLPLPIPYKYHASQAKFRFMFGGTRSGKTHSAMIDMVMFALGIHPFRPVIKNAVIWCATVNWEMVGEVLWGEKLCEMIPFDMFHKIAWHNKAANTPRAIWLTNGSRIVFKTFEQGREAFQGKSIHACYCDEQSKSDSVGIFREIQGRLIDTDGFYSHSMTPLIPCPWLESRIEKPGSSDEMFFANLNDNRKSRGGYIRDSAIDLMIAEWPEEVQETRIKGLFAAFEGVVYKAFSRKTHVIPEFKIPDDWDRYRGIDFGYSNPFACAWLARSPDGEWHLYREHHEAGKLLAWHCDRILRASGDERYRWTCADHDAQGRAEINERGIPTVPARKAILAGIESVQGTLKIRANGRPRFFIHSNCPVAAVQMSGYRWPEGTDTKDPKDEPIKKDDHILDPVRYIIQAVEGDGKYVEAA